jgi:dihydrodipicolinate synthase/N-acetylneuraminate lyase
LNTTLRGTIAASVTPFTDDGSAVDEEAVPSLLEFFDRSGLDGVLAMGTTGEGVLLSMEERLKVIDLFVADASPTLAVVAHCGAQTTPDTVRLAAHAAEAGAAGVAVIGPPYFELDGAAIYQHFLAAGRACAPLPFFVYEFAARSGYAVPLQVLERLRQDLPNLAGLKVSDTPWENFEPYLIDGLAIFVGPETLISRGLARGAVGAVSALATALPELTIEAVRSGTPEASAACGAARGELLRFPFHSALKRVLARRGVGIGDGVRGPLRRLSAPESAELDAVIDRVLGSLASATSRSTAGS